MRDLVFNLATLAVVAAIGACSSTTTGGGSGGAGGGTTGTGGSGGGTTATAGTGGAGGAGGAMAGTGGAGGAGGAGDCNVMPPVGGLDPNDCGGSAAVGTGGGITCEYFCSDQSQNEYGVECDGATCKCKVNGQVICECPQQDIGCTTSCCPDPWPHDGGGGAGGGSSGNTSAVAGSTGSG